MDSFIPEHLTEVSSLVIEFGPDQVYRGMLGALCNSGQAFNFRTVAKAAPIGTEDAFGGKIRFVVKGRCYAESVVDQGSKMLYTLDDLVMYRVIAAHGEVGGAGGWIIEIALADDPFQKHKRAAHTAGHTFGGQEKFGLDDDYEVDVTKLIRLGGRVVTELIATVTGEGHVNAEMVAEVIFDQLSLSQDERDRFMADYYKGNEIAQGLFQQLVGYAMRAAR